MAGKHRPSHEQERLNHNRRAINEAQQTVARSALGSLLRAVRVTEWAQEEGAPEIAAIDPVEKILYLNQRCPKVRSRDEWASTIGHLLLHLGLNHAARREEREPLLWNLACDEVARKLLPLFNLHCGAQRSDAAADEREEEIYDWLLAEQRTRKSGGVRSGSRIIETYAGRGRPAILGLGRPHAWSAQFEQLPG